MTFFLIALAVCCPIAALLYGGWKIRSARQTVKLKASIRQEQQLANAEYERDLAIRRQRLQQAGYWTRDLYARKD